MPKYIPDTLLEKFMRHVSVPASTKIAPCWLWAGSVDSHGYGQIASTAGAAPHKAHRVAWTLAYGAIPKGMFVCHKCDTRACVRPGHLFLGTQLDNMNDCSKKNRVRRKLTAEDVIAIRASTLSQRKTAEKFGVVKSAVSAILARKTWKNV